MATNFVTQFAITGFEGTIVTRRLVMEGGFSGRPTKCKYSDNPKLWDVTIATVFWLLVSYNWLYDS